MKRLLPHVRDVAAFGRVVRDEGALAPGVAQIVEGLGVRAGPSASPRVHSPCTRSGASRAQAVPTVRLRRGGAEARFLDVLDGRLPIATPKLHAVGALEGWGYVLMGRLPGDLLVSACRHIERPELRTLMTRLGETLRALHSLRDARLGPDRSDWPALVRERKETTLALQRTRGLSPQWLEQIPDFLDTECPRIEAAAAEAPLHTEVMREHLFVERRRGAWRLAGLFDFEPSMVGAAEYEFSAVGVFVSCGDRELFRDVLLGYGYAENELDHAFERRILAHALLHKYSNLSWYLNRVPPPAHAAKLDELAPHFFGV